MKDVGKFYCHSVYFMVISYTYIFYGHQVKFVVILVYFSRLGLLYRGKSGNPYRRQKRRLYSFCI
jgi:hypothetical protein